MKISNRKLGPLLTSKSSKTCGEALASSAAIGLVLGKYADSNGDLKLPGTQLDAEFAIGAGLLFAAHLDLLDRFSGDAWAAGLGVSCHWVGQAARNFAKK